MSTRQRRADLTKALEQQVSQTRLVLGGAATGARRVEDLPLDALVFAHQPRQIIPPAVLADLVARGEAHPATVLAALQEWAAQGEPWATILADLERMATTIRPPGQVHVPILYYRAEDGAWVVYSGHRRCLASLLARRNTVPAIEVSGQSAAQRELDRIVVETQHADWTAIEQALALRDARDQLRSEYAGRRLSDLTMSDLNAIGREPEFSDRAVTEALTGRQLDAVVTALVVQRTGIGRRQYYRLVALADKLDPEAQALAQEMRLTEAQIRAVTQIDPALQAACVRAIAQHGLTQRQAEQLVTAVLAGTDPQEEASRLAGAGTPAAPAKKPASTRPQPPEHLSQSGWSLWQDLHRVSTMWEWALDPDQAERRLSALSDLDRETLWGLAAVARAALDEFVARLQPG